MLAFFLSFLGLASSQYFESANHDGFQIGSKYFFFPSARGTVPDRMRFSDSKNLCISFGGTLAIPMNEEEDEAAKSFLSDHFSG